MPAPDQGPRSKNNYALIIPALNEAQSIGQVLGHLPGGLFSQVIVVDNGSEDSTAQAARTAGAQVVQEPRRGYGQACLAGLAQVRPGTTAVAFMDARVLGDPEPGSLTPLQRFGNWVATRLMRWIWGVSYTDLGPLRVLGTDALRRLNLRDPDFGWNVEMQAKAARLGLKVTEVPVSYRRRKFGQSKISGSVLGSLAAGLGILLTVYRCWRQDVA